ncbi:hypothetical protein [Nocardia niigatensis]
MTRTCGNQSCGKATKRPRRGLCPACYRRHARRQTAYGRWRPDRTPAEPVRAHVRRLLDAGLSRRQIAAEAGLGYAVVSQVLTGRRGRPCQSVADATASAVLGVKVPDRRRTKARAA